MRVRVAVPFPPFVPHPEIREEKTIVPERKGTMKVFHMVFFITNPVLTNLRICDLFIWCQKKKSRVVTRPFSFLFSSGNQYSPPYPPGGIPPPIGIFSSLGFSAIITSVVSNRDATLDAFWRAVLTTFVGSITPAFDRSSYFSV